MCTDTERKRVRERNTCTPTCTNNYTAKIVIRHANCLPRLCLTDILCLHCQTHMESNRKHLILFITAASISHRSKIDILEETQTDAHKHTHNLPLIQNTSRTNRKIPSIFFFSLRESTSRQPQTASRTGYMAAWKKSHSNGPNLLLQLQRSRHTHVHAFPRCMRAHKSEHSCQFNMVLKALMARH